MAITEQSRKRLYDRLEHVLGDEEATTLMEHLPPGSWNDLATKQDLGQLEERMTLRFERDLARVEHTLGGRMSSLEHELAKLRTDFQHSREVGDLRFAETDRRFLTKTEFYRTITAQTITLVLFMAALFARMGG